MCSFLLFMYTCLLVIFAGRQDPDTPASKRLNTDENSNIIVFMSGHGGEDFLKFQDFDHISGADIASAFKQMYEQRRFNEILFFADTCHAGSLIENIHTPGIFSIASSRRDENAYSHHHDDILGISVIDEFTHSVLNFFGEVRRGKQSPYLANFVKWFRTSAGKLRSTVVYEGTNFKRNPK